MEGNWNRKLKGIGEKIFIKSNFMLKTKFISAMLTTFK